MKKPLNNKIVPVFRCNSKILMSSYVSFATNHVNCLFILIYGLLKRRNNLMHETFINGLLEVKQHLSHNPSEIRYVMATGIRLR